MIKQDLINNVSKSTGVDKDVCRMVIEESIASVRTALCNGESIYLRGLFTLKPLLRAEKKAQFIYKNQTIVVPAHYAPYAKFSKEIVKKMMKDLPVKK